MKILITGGAGFIGTNLCEALQKNHTVVSIDNYSIGLKTNHIDGVKYIDADVLDIVNKVENDFDICFHLAGLSRIQPSFTDPVNTFNSNTMGVLSVVELRLQGFIMYTALKRLQVESGRLLLGYGESKLKMENL